MKKTMIVELALTCLMTCVIAAEATAKDPSGEELFRKHCFVCHPKGGNVINPAKTLSKKNLEAEKISEPQDIVAKMRKPGPGMTPFDNTIIPDQDALKIADYILSTFQ